jgi:endoglucanase
LPPPGWPLKDSNGNLTSDRQTLAKSFQPWAEAAARVPIHFGEMGCYKHTPPGVVIAWFEDSLSVFDDLGAGWALWNFRGPFGILDTERDGTKFDDWHGHKLDSKLLTVLQAHMKR